MHSTTVLGYTFDGAAYCPDHQPTTGTMSGYVNAATGAPILPDDIGVIFADAENVWDMHCDICREPLDDMPEPLPGYVATMVEHYLICALWASTGDDGEPLDRTHDADDISAEFAEQAEQDCDAFARSMFGYLYRDGWTAEQAGHDFWLTRNRHGAGFWDRGKDSGDILTRMSRPYGECDPYVGDDGLIYA